MLGIIYFVSLFIFLSSGTLFVMIAWYKRVQRDCQKINVQKLHHYLKFSMMFVTEDFSTMNGQWVRGHTLIKGIKHKT